MPSANRVIVVAVAASVLVSPAIPGPLGEPGRRLVNADADARDPRWDRPLDGEALRHAAPRVRETETYHLAAERADPVLIGNLKAAGQLFFSPSLPVRDPDLADVRVRYGGGTVAVSPRRGDAASP